MCWIQSWLFNRAGTCLLILAPAYVFVASAVLPRLALYQTFGQDFDRIEHGIELLFFAYWLVWMIVLGIEARKQQKAHAGVLAISLRGAQPYPLFWVRVGVTLTMVGTLIGIFTALPVVNAWLDFGSSTPTAVYADETGSFSSRSRYGGGRTGNRFQGWAKVHRLDHPDERVTLEGWPRGELPAKSKPSPLATVWLRRGAFGVTWVDRIERKPLAIADKPLFGTFHAGKGTPLLVVTLPSGTVPDARQVKLRAQFLATLQEVADTGAISASGATKVVELFSEDEPVEIRALYWKFGLAGATADQPLGPRLSLVKQLLSHQYLGAIGLEGEDLEALRALLGDVDSASKEERRTCASRAKRRLEELFSDFDRHSAFLALAERLQRSGPAARIVVVWGAPFERTFDAACDTCTVLDAGEPNAFHHFEDDTIDWDIFGLITRTDEPFDRRGRVYAIDGAGVRAGAAELLNASAAQGVIANLGAMAKSRRQ